MPSTTINVSILIDAPRRRVWDILLQEQYTKIWTAIFGEAIKADMDWRLGGKVAFVDKTGNGLFGSIVRFEPLQLVTMEFAGIFYEHEEDRASAEARKWCGTYESYRLSEENGTCRFSFEQELPAEYAESTQQAWQRAAQLIKELAESTQ